MTPADSANELRDWLTLWRAPRIGSRTFQLLLEHFSSPTAVLQESTSSLKSLGLHDVTVKALKSPPWAQIENDLRWLETNGHHCILLNNPAYPRLLKEIPDPPPMLFVNGHIAALTCPQIAVVGSRNPSPTGAKLAHDFAQQLAQSGLAITSGLALGIDAAAHRGALDSRGVTLAVAGTGLDLTYPSRHQALADALVEQGGALVSEFPTATPPQAGNFPRRNRIISGLSLGTLVVEAALRSGSLITARTALEQGREVFAIPGSIHNPLARGCNALIKQGAKLVETVSDILEELGLAFAPSACSEPENLQEDNLAPELGALLKNIAYAQTSVDTLVAATGKSPNDIASMLLLLELQGLVSADCGGRYTRIK